jgi:DnaD/phage-associated family protein
MATKGTAIEGTASGFTLCPDELVEKYSHTTALVWGKVWRYCQMKDGVCKASIDRIAKELGLSDVTIGKHIKLLEEGTYIKDLTPDVRNKPHEYIDTGRLKLKVSIFMEQEEEGTKNFGTNKLGSHYQESWHEESTTDSFSLYESNIGPLTPMIADSIKDAEKTYPLSWIAEAINLSVLNNKRNWRYCETILKRWQTDGKDDGKGKTPVTAPKSSMPTYDANGRVVYA